MTDCEALSSAVSVDRPFASTAVDAVLYALGAGFGSSPDHPQELAYAFQQPLLRTVPAFATMLVDTDFLTEYGWNAKDALGLEHKLELFRPLPAACTLAADQRVVAAGKAPSGVIRIVVHSDVRLAADDTAIFSLRSTLASPAAGAFAGRFDGQVVRHRPPARGPDLSCDLDTRVEQSLLACVNDPNPLHADPRAAGDAGYAAPLMHGRSVLGIACRAILRTICDYDYTLIRGIEARFSGPVHPGDTVTTDMWQDGSVVSFRCSVRAREAIVIESGRCTLTG